LLLFILATSQFLIHNL